MFHYTRLERLARYKLSSLLGPVISYKDNEMLWITWILASNKNGLSPLRFFIITQSLFCYGYSDSVWCKHDIQLKLTYTEAIPAQSFGLKLLTLFCKLDHISSLEKSIQLWKVKFTEHRSKRFCSISSWS